MDIVFDTLVENFRLKSGISSFKIRKKCQTFLFFGKKPFVSNLFSGDIEQELTTPLKIIRQQTSIFLLIAHKSKSLGYCQIFSPEVLGSAGHLEWLPGSSSFPFEVFADAKFADLKPLADFYSENLKVFR